MLPCSLSLRRWQEETNDVLLFSTELTCEEFKIDSDIIMMPERSTLEKIIALLENMMNPR